MSPESILTAKRYAWGQGCEGWHLLRAPGLHVIQERVPPGAGERRHFHGSARQFFYVLSGRAVMEVEGQEHLLQMGDCIHVPPGANHQFRNPFGEPVDFLVVSQPSSHGDRTDLP
ncbi:MAG: cupin domain-containing protein [Acidobacteria bacterium]|nr:cupin domain-containing protein [Acidobacteriota bacterium]